MKYVLRAPRGKTLKAEHIELEAAGVTVHEVTHKMALVEGDLETLEDFAKAKGWLLFSEEYYHVNHSRSELIAEGQATSLARLKASQHAAELYLDLVVKGIEDGVVAEEDVSGGRWTGCNDWAAFEQTLAVNADFRAAFALRAHVNSFRQRLWAIALELGQGHTFEVLGKEVENESEGPVSGTARSLSELKSEFTQLKEHIKLLELSHLKT